MFVQAPILCLAAGLLINDNNNYYNNHNYNNNSNCNNNDNIKEDNNDVSLFRAAGSGSAQEREVDEASRRLIDPRNNDRVNNTNRIGYPKLFRLAALFWGMVLTAKLTRSLLFDHSYLIFFHTFIYILYALRASNGHPA